MMMFLIGSSALAQNTMINQQPCIFGFTELGCNATSVKITDLTVTERQKYWNLGLWFTALFGKEWLVREIMRENSLFSLHLCNNAVSDFFALFYKQFGRMIGLGGLMGFIKYSSVSYNALLRKQETQKLLRSYLTSHQFYDALFNSDINDTDHRVSTDVMGMVDAKVKMMNNGLMLPFLIIFYSYTVWKEMTLLGLFGIYGFFIVSAVFIRLVMAPVSTVLQQKEEAEAEYRYLVSCNYNRISHSLVLNNGEQIAFGNGEQHEYDQLSHFLNRILNIQKNLSIKQGYLEAATSFFANFGGILTYLILSVSFFAGNYDSLSTLEKASKISTNAFYAMYLIQCLTNVIELSDQYTQYIAHKTRIKKLSDYLAKQVQASHSNIQNDSLEDNVLLSIHNLTISTPEKKLLVSNLSFKVEKGKHCFITGSNGSGKTSFARVLSNLWLPSNGSIVMNTNVSPRPTSMFLPQKPFIADGSLLDVVAYPFWYSSLNETLQANVHNLLNFIKTQVNFTSLESHFSNPEKEYSSSQYSQLSPGEMQKLSFLRILFWKPLLAVFDESTSSMDRDSAIRLYSIVDMFDITIISISHQEYLKPFHAQVIDLDNPEPGKN